MILPVTTFDSTHEMEATSQETSEQSGLFLRIRGGTHDGRLVRLAQRKCTIGASPSCTLRLVNPECQPVHCVIVRGRRGTAVRRWSHDTRLNGQDFLDSWLQPGDCLEVGGVTLEIVADRLTPDENRGALMRTLETEHRRQITTNRLTESRRLNRKRVERLVRLVRRTSQHLGQLLVDVSTERSRVDELTEIAGRLQQELDATSERQQVSEQDADSYRRQIESLEATLANLESQLDEQRCVSERHQQVWLKHCRQVMEMLQLTQGELGAAPGHDVDWVPLAGELTQRLAASHQEASDYHASIEAELAARRERLDDQFQQLLENQQHLLERETKLEQLRRDLEEQLANEKLAADRTQQLAAELAEERARQQKVEAQFDTQRAELQAEWDRLHEERQSLLDQPAPEFDSSEWECRINALQAEVTDVKSECSQAYTQVQILEGERLELLREVESLQSRLTQANETVAQLDTAKATVADREQEVIDLTERCGQLEQELTKWQDSSASSIAEADSLRSALEAAEQMCRESETDRQSLEEQLEASREQLNSGEVFAAMQERNSLIEQLAETERRLREMQVALDYERSRAVESLDDYGSVARADDASLASPATVGETENDDLDNRTICLTEQRDAWNSSDLSNRLYEQTSGELAVSPSAGLPEAEEGMVRESGFADEQSAMDCESSESSAFGGDEQDPDDDEVHETSLPSAEPPLQNVEPSNFSPTDTALILAKFGASFRFADEEDEATTEVEPLAPSDVTTLPSAHGRQPNHDGRPLPGEEDESSIQSYMAELMRRNGVPIGMSVEPVRVPTPPRAPKQPVVKPVPQQEIDPASGEMVRRAKMPQMNLTAMRDVANSTAQGDITRHTVQRVREHAFFSWALSAAFLAVAVGLGMITSTALQLVTGAAAACFCASILWAFLGLSRWQQIRIAQLRSIAKVESKLDTGTDEANDAPLSPDA